MRNNIIIFIISIVFLSGCTKKHETRQIITIPPNSDITDIVKKSTLVKPSPRQWEWQKLETTAFIHFTVNTFTNMEWGTGKESPEIFNPTDFSADQMAKVCKQAGLKLMIITAKHHDGFCLWPSKYTDHSVKSSPWKDGEGDVLKELSEACKKYGIKLGVYLSPWDRHDQRYGTDEYNTYFKNQLRELLTNYGEIAEVWFDGACGEGPNGKKQVYDWEGYYTLIRDLVPDAVIAVMGPDVRWVGTETGYGRDTEWSVLPLNIQDKDRISDNSQQGVTFIPVGDKTKEDLGSRDQLKNATSLVWYPSEVDVSIRPGWFFHKTENNRVKTPEKLLDIYYSSVGKNSLLLLNIPPDTRGRFHENDVENLIKMRSVLDATFKENLLVEGCINEGGKQLNSTIFTDKNSETSWQSSSGLNSIELLFEFDNPIIFDRILLQEDVYNHGQRVEKFRYSYKKNNQWHEFIEGTTIGYKRLLRHQTVKTKNVKLEITNSRAVPVIGEIGFFKSPPKLKIEPKQAAFSDQILVNLTADDKNCKIRYTLDGRDPDFNSTLYKSPIKITESSVLKAFCVNEKKISSLIKTASYTKSKYGINYLSSYSSKYTAGGNKGLLDGKIGSEDYRDGMWQGFEGEDFEAVIDLGKLTTITKIDARFLQSIAQWIFLPEKVESFYSRDGKQYAKLFQLSNNIPVNETGSFVHSFEKTFPEIQTRYIKIKATNIKECPENHPGSGGKAWLFIDEIIFE